MANQKKQLATRSVSILWLLGFSLHVGGSLVHLLLVLALVVLVINLLGGRRGAAEKQRQSSKACQLFVLICEHSNVSLTAFT
jgi:uncharacterized membrane protein